MDDAELAALRARHSQWTITLDDGGYLVAVRGAEFVTAETAERLEERIAGREAGRNW